MSRWAVFVSPTGRRRTLQLWEDIPEPEVAEALGWTLGGHPQPPPAQPAWSWSALSSFDLCPRQHMAVKVLRVVAEKPSPALIEGQQVHERLAEVLRQGRALDPGKEWVGPLIASLRRHSRLAVEHSVAVTADLLPTGKWAKDVWIRAAYDVLVRSGDRAVVVDWKTGRKRDGLDQLKLMSSLLLLGVDPPRSVSSAFVWLDAREVTQLTMTQRDAVAFMRYLRTERLPALMQALTEARTREAPHDAFPAIRGWACRACPVTDCEFNGSR